MIEPGENTLLIADPFLKDPNFMRTVVYICRHSEEGSFGFVLNKQFEQSLGELIGELEDYYFPVYTGGPVQPDTIHFLHQYPELIPECHKISDDVYWGGDFEAVKALIKSGLLDQRKIKFFIGYSGWDVEQFTNELEEKSWVTATATQKIVFKTPIDDIWKESLRHLGGRYEMMINFPIDPQLN